VNDPTDAAGTRWANDYPLLSVSERWETVMQGASEHHRGEHDWSSPDPYDCSVCHVYVDLLIEAVRREDVASARSSSREPTDESRPEGALPKGLDEAAHAYARDRYPDAGQSVAFNISSHAFKAGAAVERDSADVAKEVPDVWQDASAGPCIICGVETAEYVRGERGGLWLHSDCWERASP